LDDNQLADRRRAVVLAGYSGDHAFVVDALSDPVAEIRAVALGALERLGRMDSEVIAPLLRDPDPLVRNRAARVCAAQNCYLPELLDLLDDADDTVVEVAAFALGESESVPDVVVERLCAVVLNHQDSLCREAATAALGSLGHPDGLRAILHACGDKATVRRRGVLALAAFEGDEVTAMLRHLTGDRDLQVRQSAEELLSIEEGESL